MPPVGTGVKVNQTLQVQNAMLEAATLADKKDVMLLDERTASSVLKKQSLQPIGLNGPFNQLS